MEKKRWYSSSLLLLLGLCAHAQVQLADFRYLGRLEGNWVMRTNQSIITENWKRLSDTCLEGHSWRIVGTDSSLLEVVRLVRRPDGIFYIPAVNGEHNGQPVPFRLTVLKAVGFIAENPQNDFPQKIRYRWKDENHLDARIEGREGKTYSEIIFQYTKE